MSGRQRECKPSVRKDAGVKTVNRFYRVDRRRISFIRFIFEAYEGLAVVTTIDPSKGVIVLRVAPGCEAFAEDVMSDLSKTVLIKNFKFNSEYSKSLSNDN